MRSTGWKTHAGVAGGDSEEVRTFLGSQISVLHKDVLVTAKHCAVVDSDERATFYFSSLARPYYESSGYGCGDRFCS